MPGTPNATSRAGRLEALCNQGSPRTRFDRLGHRRDPIQAHGARSPPRHPLRARPHRAEDAAQPLLPGAPLHGLRQREARVAGPLPRHEGRGRLGRGLHGGGARQPGLRLLAGGVAARLGRRRRPQSRPHVRGGPPLRLARGGRADPRRRARNDARVPLAGDRALAARERLLHARRRQERWSSTTSAGCSRTGSGQPEAVRDVGARHRLRLRRPQLPAAPVPLALLQQAHRRVRRLAREPRPLLAGDARGRARGGRRRLRDRRSALRRRARPRRRRARGGARASSGSPTTSSTSGT